MELLCDDLFFYVFSFRFCTCHPRGVHVQLHFVFVVSFKATRRVQRTGEVCTWIWNNANVTPAPSSSLCFHQSGIVRESSRGVPASTTTILLVSAFPISMGNGLQLSTQCTALRGFDNPTECQLSAFTLSTSLCFYPEPTTLISPQSERHTVLLPPFYTSHSLFIPPPKKYLSIQSQHHTHTHPFSSLTMTPLEGSGSEYASPSSFDSYNVDEVGMDSGSRVLQVMTDQKTYKTIKLPATARFDTETNQWVETDHHRLSQRRKQICFGKVTIGYRNFDEGVALADRQEGNDLHPATPRYDQVCSKRSWDSQIGHWRRMLHSWDNGPDPSTMRKSQHSLKRMLELKRKNKLQERNHFKLDGTFDEPHIVEQIDVVDPLPDVEIGRSDRGRVDGQTPPPLKIKCVLADDPNGRCKLVVSPKTMPYSPFKQLLQEKVRQGISRISYKDSDGDMVAADDDVSLKAFLEGAGQHHAAKLHLSVEVNRGMMQLNADVRSAYRKVKETQQLSEVQAAALLQELVNAPVGQQQQQASPQQRFKLARSTSPAHGSLARMMGAHTRTPKNGLSPKMPDLLSPASSVSSSMDRIQQQRCAEWGMRNDVGSPGGAVANTPMRESV